VLSQPERAAFLPEPQFTTQRDETEPPEQMRMRVSRGIEIIFASLSLVAGIALMIYWYVAHHKARKR
jgi:hypothetical protein